MPVVKHPYTNPVADDATSSWVMPSHWNASHTILGYTYKDTLYLTTAVSSTITLSGSVGAIFVRMWGGGSGGAGASASAANGAAGGGGGAGGYCEFFIGISSITTTYQYKCGTGGAGGSGSAAGAVGITTWIGEAAPGTFTALPGGATAAPITVGTSLASTAGGVGGSASNGTFMITGQSGEKGIRISGTVGNGGYGGMAAHAYGYQGVAGYRANGATAGGYGCGGGGSYVASSSSVKGGDGAQGLIILEQYY